jgi:hypothetical protein
MPGFSFKKDAVPSSVVARNKDEKWNLLFSTSNIDEKQTRMMKRQTNTITPAAAGSTPSSSSNENENSTLPIMYIVIVITVMAVDHKRTPVRPKNANTAQILRTPPALPLHMNDKESFPLIECPINTGSDCSACPQQNSNFSKVDSRITFTARALSSLLVKETSRNPSMADGITMAREAMACCQEQNELGGVQLKYGAIYIILYYEPFPYRMENYGCDYRGLIPLTSLPHSVLASANNK